MNQNFRKSLILSSVALACATTVFSQGGGRGRGGVAAGATETAAPSSYGRRTV